MRTRVSKVTYGSFFAVLYNPSDPDHISRSHRVFTTDSGESRIDGSFDIILPKVIVSIVCYYLFQKPYICRIPKFRRRRNSDSLIFGNQILQLIFELVIVLFIVTVEASRFHSGTTLIPVRVHHTNHFVLLASLMGLYLVDNYTKLCTIDVDLSRAPMVRRPKATGKGHIHRVGYDVILLFGMTELKAQVAWKEKVSGPACCSDIGLDFLRVVFREKRNGELFFFNRKRICFLVEFLLLVDRYIIYRSATRIVYDPDTTNGDL